MPVKRPKNLKATKPPKPPKATTSSATATPTIRTCGTMPVHERLLRSDAAYVAARSRSETAAWQFATLARSSQRTGVTVIPVVVHVVWNTAAQNISDAQVKSQIEVLNRDFRKTNGDIGFCPAVFQPLCADARIEFELAKADPNGTATTGIVRQQSATASFTDDDKVKSASSGGSDAWPADRYLNVWVCQLGGGLLGYAQFPGGAAATDGVVILHSAFGTTGTAAAPFHLGRTSTHEIGHWLNLRHIWGDDGNGCNGDDFVADTPNCAGSNSQIPPFPHITCNNGPNGDLFVNYMDYTDDAGMVMFTNGQMSRMQACLDHDRPTIGHAKAGPTLSFADHPTAAIVDIKPTLVQIDVHPTISVIDSITTLAQADVHPTLATHDHPTIAAFDHGTIAVVDHGPTNPIADNPQATMGGFDAPFNPGMANPGDPAPFVLATPHHTRAWVASHPAMVQMGIASLRAQAAECRQAMAQFANAEVQGALSTTEASTAEQVYAEYQRIMAELSELGVPQS